MRPRGKKHQGDNRHRSSRRTTVDSVCFRSTGSGARRNCVIDRMESTGANVHTLYVNNLNEKVSSKGRYRTVPFYLS